MNSTSCADIQAHFSSYLDGDVSGKEMQEISRHIDGGTDRQGVSVDACPTCARELAAWRMTQNALVAAGTVKAPADLGLKLRIAISHERSRRDTRLRDTLSLAWDNIVRPRLVQVSAGLAGSVVLGGIVLLLGVVAAPQPVLANDEPLGALTQPRLLYSTSYPGDRVTVRDTPVVVEALVSSTGKAYDFRIISGSLDKTGRAHVEDQLLGSVFQPASAFGVPVRGHVVMMFTGVSVHG